MESRRTRRAPLRWETIAGWLAVVMWLALSLHDAWILAPSFDEPAHLGDGLAVIRYRDFRMNPEHPPLVKALSALPVMIFTRPDLTVERDGNILSYWADEQQYLWGQYLIYNAGADPRHVMFVARILPILLGLLGGYFAWLWGATFAGRRGGLFACIFLLYYPEYLGHSHYVTMDVSAVTACAALSWMAWKLWVSPAWWRLVSLALLAAIGTLVKLPVSVYTAILVIQLGVMFLKRSRADWGFVAALFGCVILAGYAAQWLSAFGRFDLYSGVIPPDHPNRLLEHSQFGGSLLDQALLFSLDHHLLPESTIAMLSHAVHTGGREAFLFSRLSNDGWYSYFFVTILLKTPLVYLASLLIGAFVYTRRAWVLGGAERNRLLILGLPTLMLFVLTVLSRMNIGHRHVLFVYFPWAVLMGALASRWWLVGPRGRIAVAGLMVGSVGVTLFHHPEEATYFNVLAGGNARNGWKFLRDSNIDWGQDLSRAGKALNDMGYMNANLAYFGSGKPQAYGIESFRFILPDYPLAVGMPSAQPPDPNLPTIVSLHVLNDVRAMYPRLYDREPEHVVNSMVIFDPIKN